MSPQYNPLEQRSRRCFLRDSVLGLGGVALTALLNDEARSAETKLGPLAPREPHHPPRAKNCIFLFLEGGPSHIDTFDPKPKLAELHGQRFTRNDKFASAMASGTRYYVQSPFKFRRAGESGLPMNEEFEHLAGVADELCLYHGLQAESINHPTACYHMNTGNRFGGDPAVGSWVTYGLGSVNQDLPGFLVLPEAAYPQGGAANWSNGFLPAYYQGTALRPKGSPILDLLPPEGTTRDMQRENLDLLAKLNEQHREQHPHHDELAARIESYELAYRMQAKVPDLLDLSREDAGTLQRYGVGGRLTDEFGRKCLLARRLIERGVRFVQVFSGGWDSHDYIERSHRARIHSIDRPVAALLGDLRERGMLDDTLVVMCGEFGRSPDNGLRGGGMAYGRDHNAKAMFAVLAGGGVKAGAEIGATDEIGAAAVEQVRPIKDFHVTLLHLLGLNDNKLTYFHAGRFKQLSQTGGELIEELIA
jgi:hypothetical protein